MAKEDIAVKTYLKVKEHFADVFNANMFDGRQVIKPEELSEINAESDIIEECSKVVLKDEAAYVRQTRRALWRYRDIVMKWRGMILSRFRKEDVLCPVATLVFYYGKEPWDGSLELYDMFKLEAEADVVAVKEFVANYKINLVDVSDIEDLSVYHSDLKEVLGFVKCRDSRKALLDYANLHKDFFEAVDYETVNAIGAMVQGGEQYVKMIKDSKKEEKVNMCKALEDLWEDGVKTGEAQGEARGEARGIRKAVLLLRRVGTSDEMISDMIKTEYEITAEEVQKYMCAEAEN